MSEASPSTIDRCRRGDPRALEAIYADYGRRVYRLCLGLMGQSADAEDAAQEVFLRAFDKLELFDGRSQFSTWLYRLAVNHCLNRRKKRRPTPFSDLEVDPPVSSTTPLEATSQGEQQALALALLERLKPSYRAIVTLRELEDLSYREIGEILDVPVGTVMSRLSRAREELRRLAGTPVPTGGGNG